ncbi:hypothetical protein ACS0TY_026428 [Phlomoides rotata]
MKILSINARGTNIGRKRKAIKNLIRETKADMVCLQETKREVLNKEFCDSIWPDRDFGWVYSGSKAVSGGLLTLWKNSVFSLDRQWGAPGALTIQVGLRIDSNSRRTSRTGSVIDKRKLGVFVVISTQLISDKRSRLFCKFIDNLELIDLSLLRRKYTWYKDNGTCCSIIDRFFISKKWCSLWPNLKQIGLKRTFSDHAPILLEATEKENWGPIPFKVVNWWIDQKDFRSIVENSWMNSKIEGWGGFVFKEKLKILKADIKLWKKNNGTSLGQAYQTGHET